MTKSSLAVDACRKLSVFREEKDNLAL